MHQISDGDMALGPLNISTEEANDLAEYMYDQLLKDTIRGQCLEFHRAVKLGFFFLDESGSNCEEKHELVHREGFDIFGQSYKVKNKNKFFPPCPVCKACVSYMLYASHLAKCMKIGGRSSSRVAKERIANAKKAETKDDNESEIESEIEDYDNYDNDGDWNDSSDRKPKKKGKNAPKKTNKRKGKNNGGGAIDSTDWDYERMSFEQKKWIFDQVCGVLSDYDNKVCTRSQRCSLHTKEQQKQIRDYYLTRPSIDDDIQINVDTVD